MASKKKTAARKSAPPPKTAAELHELARKQRRAGDTEAAAQTIEQAREAERVEESSR